MRRGGMNGTLAAEAIASLENRVPRASIQKRRWARCWSWRLYWCFRSHKNTKRIRHGVFLPEPSSAPRSTEHLSWPPPMVLPFVAPPPSPASLVPSEPHSLAPSPTGQLSLASLSANAFSPIFVTGPYAHETQLVSPPVLWTEPSTGQHTPPQESGLLTAPSSPEVPFAQLLEYRPCTQPRAVEKPVRIENLKG